MGDVEERLVEVLEAHSEITFDLGTPRQYTGHGEWNQSCKCGHLYGSQKGVDSGWAAHLATAVLASPLLAEVAADARREALREAAGALHKKAVAEFDYSGPHSPRGAAIWDSACAINPDDGDILGSSAARSGPRADREAASRTPEGGR